MKHVDTNLKDEPNKPAFLQHSPPPTFGTVTFQNNAPPPPLSQSAAPPPPPPPPPTASKRTEQSENNAMNEKSNEAGGPVYYPKNNALLADIIKADGKPLRQGDGKASGEKKEELNNDKGRLSGGLMDDLKETLQNRRRGIAGGQKNNAQQNNVQQSNKLGGAFNKVSDMILPPRRRSNSVSSSSNGESDHEDSNEWVDQTPSNHQPDNEEGTSTTDSGNVYDGKISQETSVQASLGSQSLQRNESLDSGCVSGNGNCSASDTEEEKTLTRTSSNSQSDSKKRSGSFDSGHGSDSESTSSSHSTSKAGGAY
ncbi:hypothetical protein [Wolbachia endosymbiont of Cantharis cryptica]|uniref:hypothetical protein n=1 Tax=Wolbachia endosymbiont of Cantharis cryptica TaxID=3066132 RepID=UPI00376F3EAC